MRGGIETFQATCRMFMGLYSAAADIGNVNPSTLLNMVGIGFDSGQTTLRLLRNDGSGTATAVDLGAGFPTTRSQVLCELILSAEPNGSDIRYRIERLNSGDLAEGEDGGLVGEDADHHCPTLDLAILALERIDRVNLVRCWAGKVI
jgi:hypothetical protein